MKLKRIEARNFLSFGEDGLVLDRLGMRTIVVGPNSSGKTNINRVIEFVLQVFSGGQPDPRLARHNGCGPEPIVRLCVSLDDEEAEAFADWMVITSKFNPLNSLPGEEVDWGEARRLTGLLLDRMKPTFKTIGSGWVEFAAIGVGNPAFPYEAVIRIRSGDDAHDLFLSLDGQVSGSRISPSGSFRVELRRLILEELRARFPRSIERGPESIPLSPQEFESIAESLGPEWFFQRMEDRGSTPTSLDVRWLDLQAYETQLGGRSSDATNLRQFLTGRGWSSGSPLNLVQLLTQILRSSVGALEDYRSMGTGPDLPEPQSVGIGHSILGGSGLASGLYALKNSSNRAERRIYCDIQHAFERATGGMTVEAILEAYVSTQGASDTAPSEWIPVSRLASGLRLGQGHQRWISVPAIRIGTDSFEFSPSAAASGLKQLLAILSLACSARHSVLFLDEPELNLHPSKQREILRALLDESDARSNQVILVTHSPNLIDPRQLPDMVRLAPHATGSRMFRPPPGDRAAMQEMARKFERTPRILSALFATKVVLVEGASEEAALPIWIDKMLNPGLLASRNLEFVDVGGEGGFEPLAEILRSWGVPFRVVCDSKSASAVRVFGADAYAYPKEDFSKILEDECALAFQAANTVIRSRSGAKSVAVAREVALQTDPPPVVQHIYDFLRPFLDGSD